MSDYSAPAVVTSDSAAPGSAWFNQMRTNGEAIHRPPRARFISMDMMRPTTGPSTNPDPIPASSVGTVYWAAPKAANGDVINSVAGFGSPSVQYRSYQRGIAGSTATAEPFVGSSNTWTGGAVNDGVSGVAVSVTDALSVPADGLYLVIARLNIGASSAVANAELLVGPAPYVAPAWAIAQQTYGPLVEVLPLLAAEDFRIRVYGPASSTVTSVRGSVDIVRIGDV